MEAKGDTLPRQASQFPQWYCESSARLYIYIYISYTLIQYSKNNCDPVWCARRRDVPPAENFGTCRFRALDYVSALRERLLPADQACGYSISPPSVTCLLNSCTGCPEGKKKKRGKKRSLAWRSHSGFRMEDSQDSHAVFLEEELLPWISSRSLVYAFCRYVR